MTMKDPNKPRFDYKRLNPIRVVKFELPKWVARMSKESTSPAKPVINDSHDVKIRRLNEISADRKELDIELESILSKLDDASKRRDKPAILRLAHEEIGIRSKIVDNIDAKRKAQGVNDAVVRHKAKVHEAAMRRKAEVFRIRRVKAERVKLGLSEDGKELVA